MRVPHFKSQLICIALLLCVGSPTLVSASPFGYADLSDAPAPYSEASSSTGDYQRLGIQYGVDDGVSWSIDGGKTFGHDDVMVGQTIRFKYDIASHNIGGHIFDPIRSWFDTNGDGSWSSSEMIFSDIYTKATDSDYWLKGTPDDPIPDGSNPYNSRHWNNGAANDWVKTSFLSELYLSEDTHIGDTWLRTRITCDASLGGIDFRDPSKNWTWQAVAGDINKMGPDGWLHQGEIEDFKIHVLARPSLVTVPEPSGALLLIVGFLTLLLVRLRAVGIRN